MNRSYTPGPWRSHLQRNGGLRDRAVESDGGCPVAVVQDGGNDDQLKANTALIAAAPEMLHKLIRMHQYLGSLVGIGAVTGPTIEAEIGELSQLILAAQGK